MGTVAIELGFFFLVLWGLHKGPRPPRGDSCRCPECMPGQRPGSAP